MARGGARLELSKLSLELVPRTPILSLPIIFFADWTMTQVFMAVEDPRYGSLLSAILLYLLTIFFIGMVSPYSIRLLVSSQEHSGRMAGLLYFISTLGSALGTLMTSFYLVLWFKVNHIMWGIVIGMVACGALILIAHAIAERRSQP